MTMDNETRQTTGEVVRYWRTRSHLRQQELAEMLDVARTTVVNIEQNKRRLSLAEIRFMEQIFTERTGEVVGLESTIIEADELTAQELLSQASITVGVIDSILAMCRVLNARDTRPDIVQSALAGLAENETFKQTRHAAVRAYFKKHGRRP